jgi:hypothetical protein
MRLEPRYAPCPRCRATRPCAHERPAFDRSSTLVDEEGTMVIDLTGGEDSPKEPTK